MSLLGMMAVTCMSLALFAYFVFVFWLIFIKKDNVEISIYSTFVDGVTGHYRIAAPTDPVVDTLAVTLMSDSQPEFHAVKKTFERWGCTVVPGVQKNQMLVYPPRAG